MWRIKKILLLLLITFCISSCGKEKEPPKSTEKKIEWNEKDFANLGISDFKQIGDYKLNVYNTAEESVTLTMSCIDTCEYQSINSYLQELFNKVKQISDGEIFNKKINEDFSYSPNTKINSYEETIGIQYEGYVESEYIYKYNNKHYLIYIVANIKDINININEIN